MQNWFALLIAFGVLFVGYAQWRTANQRVVLDLFDRRMKVFEKIKDAIGEVMTSGEVSADAFNKFISGQFDATFLFGIDVQNYIDKMRKDMAFMMVYRGPSLEDAANRGALIDRKAEALLRITKFYDDILSVFGPYMALTQRNTPFWRPW